MRSLLLIAIVTGLGLGISSSAFAVCEQTGNTPGGGNIINCPSPVQNTALDLVSNPATTELPDEVNIPAGGGVQVVGPGRAIETRGGEDIITTSGDSRAIGQVIASGNQDDTIIVNGGSLISVGSQAIGTSNGNDTIVINDGVVRGAIDPSGDQAIFTGDDNDMITINGGRVVGNRNQAIFTASGDDKIIVNGGIIEVINPVNQDELFFTSSGEDMVELNGGTYIKGSDEAIDLGSEDDMLTFGTDIDLGEGALVNCSDDFDTLVFAMNVREPFLAEAKERLAAATVPDGNVRINGIRYQWINCELLVDELQAGPPGNLKPIPTLSQWGLIAMAGLIGFAGLLVMRRRAAV